MSVPDAVLDIVRQDELERTHEVYQDESQGPFFCYRCIFRKNPGATRCGHPTIVRLRAGQIAPKACCDFYKLDPAVAEKEAQEAVAKRYDERTALNAWAKWAYSGERFDKQGNRVKDGQYARNLLELAVSSEDHAARKKATPEVVEAYGRPQAVDPTRVVSGQRRLNVERLLQYVLDPCARPTKGPHGLDGDLPVIMRRRREYSMVDGNHRVAAAKLKGEKTIDCVVVDMDKAERKKFEGVIEFQTPPSLKSLLPKIGKREMAHPDLVGRKASKWHVHDVADKHVEAFKRAVARAFELGRAELSGIKDSRLSIMTTAEKARKASKSELERVLPALLSSIAAESGAQAYQKLVTRPLLKRWFRKDDGFDSRHPGMQAWVKRHTAELVVGIDETTRSEIADFVNEAYTSGTSRRDLINSISDLIGDNDRATMIARTETMRAANAGQREGWSQAIEDGYLETDAKRVWIVTDDDVLCEDCADLDGEEADIEGNYPGEGGDGPPLHPDCRCTEGLA